ERVRDATVALKQPTTAKILSGQMGPRGDTVDQVVYSMTANGLTFARCQPGHENAYVAMHTAFVNFAMGTDRPDTGFRVRVPGDTIHLAVEVQNMTFDSNGKASYAMGLEIVDPKGTELLKQKPRTASALNYLGGTTMPCAANLQVPLESAPGTYTFRVTVIDN